MTVLSQVQDDSGYITAKVYESRGEPGVEVRCLKGDITEAVVLRFDLTEETLNEIRGSDPGSFKTSAYVYDLITDAVAETEYSRML